MTLLLAGAIGAAIPSGSREAADLGRTQPAAPCPRPPKRQWRAGDTVVVQPLAQAACALAFQSTGTHLLVDSADVDEIGERIVRDSRGRLYTYSGRGQITAWNPDGRALATFGRQGAGPGEFEQGALHIHPAKSRQLYVFDSNQRRWTVFDSAYRFLRTVQYSGGAATPRAALLDDGTFLDADRPEAGRPSFLVSRLSGPEAIRLNAFGDLSPSEQAARPRERERLVSYTGGDAFWAGPPTAVGRGYELQYWSTSGHLLRTLRRTPRWYPEGVDRSPPGGSTPAPGQLGLLWSLGDGLLLVGLTAPNARWAEQVRRAAATRGQPCCVSAAAILAEGIDTYLELIDTDAGVVLWAAGPKSASEMTKYIPTGWFQGTSTGYRLVELSSGFRSAEIVGASLTRVVK